jgi:hypothetical protein
LPVAVAVQRELAVSLNVVEAHFQRHYSMGTWDPLSRGNQRGSALPPCLPECGAVPPCPPPSPCRCRHRGLALRFSCLGRLYPLLALFLQRPLTAIHHGGPRHGFPAVPARAHWQR